MVQTRKVKIAMLAATSLFSAAAALVPAHAGELDPAAFPAIVEAPVVSHAADQLVQADHDNKPAQRAALIAVALGALGWLVKLLGPKKVLRAVEKTAEATVKATAAASGAAAKTVGRALRSPLRALAWIAGVVLFALTGVGLYDVEWIGGMIAGAALAGAAAWSVARARGLMQLRPIRVKSAQERRQN